MYWFPYMCFFTYPICRMGSQSSGWKKGFPCWLDSWSVWPYPSKLALAAACSQAPIGFSSSSCDSRHRTKQLIELSTLLKEDQKAWHAYTFKKNQQPDTSTHNLCSSVCCIHAKSKHATYKFLHIFSDHTMHITHDLVLVPLLNGWYSDTSEAVLSLLMGNSFLNYIFHVPSSASKNYRQTTVTLNFCKYVKYKLW